MRRGFTLIEFILYVALVSIVLLGVLSFTWVIIQAELKQTALTHVYHQGQQALVVIQRTGQDAASVSAGASSFDVNPGTLVLTMPDDTARTFDTYERTILQDETAVPIRTLRMQTSSGEQVDLTGPQVTVHTFSVVRRPTSGADSISIYLQLKAVNPENNVHYAATYSEWGTFTLRKQQ